MKHTEHKADDTAICCRVATWNANFANVQGDERQQHRQKGEKSGGGAGRGEAVECVTSRDMNLVQETMENSTSPNAAPISVHFTPEL